MTTILFVVLSIVVALFVRNNKWSEVKNWLKQPLHPGEHCAVDAPDTVVDGRTYRVTLFKDLSADPFKGYTFEAWLVHDSDHFEKIGFSAAEMAASGLSELNFIKKKVYNL